MSALTRAELHGDAARIADDLRREDRIPADDGAIPGGQNVEVEVRGDGLRGSGVALLQANQVRAAGADGVNALVEAQTAADPDVEAHHFQLRDWSGLQ